MSDPNQRKEGDKPGLSTGEKVGIGAGAVVGTAALAMGAAFLFRKLFGESSPNEEIKQQAFVGTPKTALQVLEMVSSSIKLKKESIKERNQFMLNLIRVEIIDDLCAEEPLFNSLYQDILWTGSYYEGLKINEADEYDLNIILRLPTKKNNIIEVTTRDAPPANVRLAKFREFLQELKKLPHWEKYQYAKMEKWCSPEGCLLQDKVRSWLESLLGKCMNRKRDEIIEKFGLDSIKVAKHGPALTLEISYNSKLLSIDLVPAFEFKPSLLPPQPFRKLPYELPWYAVPKPVVGRNDVWRLSFCKHEREMIHDRRNVKPAIKLIKKLRDSRKWDNLASYFIKTVAYWKLYEKDPMLHGKLDEVFMHLLRQLQKAVEENSLTYFWDPRYNILANMSNEERINLAGSIKRIIKRIEAVWKDNPIEIARIIDPDGDWH